MSSSRKTQTLRLNQWSSSDIPKRDDFNYDNNVLETTYVDHISENGMHTSFSEKAIWNTPYIIETYFGDGQSQKTITLNCDFDPRWGIVFAVAHTPSQNDYDNKADYNYFTLFSAAGSQVGVSVIGKKLIAQQSSIPFSKTEYKNFNENGTTYVVIAFR